MEGHENKQHLIGLFIYLVMVTNPIIFYGNSL